METTQIEYDIVLFNHGSSEDTLGGYIHYKSIFCIPSNILPISVFMKYFRGRSPPPQSTTKLGNTSTYFDPIVTSISYQPPKRLKLGEHLFMEDFLTVLSRVTHANN